MIDRKIVWEKWQEPKPTPLDEEGDERIPQLFTPIGYVSQKLYAGARNDFKFWVGNTNFNINKYVYEIIDRTDGVEVFSVFARYKFRFSPGKCFKASDVKRNIEINLDCNLKFGLLEESYYDIKSLQIKLRKAKLPWLIYILPNGKYEWVQIKDPTQLNDTFNAYQQAKQTIGGYVLSSGV